MQQSEVLEIFRALANENRQQILFGIFCDKQQHSVGEVAERSGLAQSTASEHLAILRRAGILKSEKVNRQVFYRVNKDAFEQVLSALQAWLKCC